MLNIRRNFTCIDKASKVRRVCLINVSNTMIYEYVSFIRVLTMIYNTSTKNYYSLILRNQGDFNFFSLYFAFIERHKKDNSLTGFGMHRLTLLFLLVSEKVDKTFRHRLYWLKGDNSVNLI